MATWVWIVGAVALAFLLLAVALPYLNRSTAPLAQNGMVATPTPDTPFGIGGAEEGLITDPATIANVSDANEYRNRDVQFISVPVQEVLGDRIIMIGSSRAESVPVVRRDRWLGTDDPMPEVGSRVSIEGQVRELRQGFSPFDGLDTSVTQQLSGERIYVDAQSIEVVD